MENRFRLNDLLQFDRTEVRKYHIHAAKRNGKGEEPLVVFSQKREEWQKWQEYRGEKDRFARREFIFSMMQDPHRQDKYVFGGIFRIRQRSKDGYEVELCETLKPLIGRLVIDCSIRNRNTVFLLETYLDKMYVHEILEKSYEGIPFPGFENVRIDFPMLVLLTQNQKEDWRAALSSVKGIYVISDKSNGKQYVGSASGENGIWERWCGYGRTAHGDNDELVALIEAKGLEYAHLNFQFSILEILPKTLSADDVVKRENHWKDVLLSKVPFGYNRN